MKTNDIVLRDPYVILHEGKYYMYGTRSLLCWKKPQDISTQGFDVYVSEDLENWSDPIEVFKRPNDFWADKNFWAPEVHLYKGEFYMFATFIGEGKCRGTQILKATSPLGPFTVHSPKPITPPDWECLDGTLYIDKKGVPHMVFCHEWVQIKDGTVSAVQLSEDLKQPVGKPWDLFCASQPKWADKNADRYVTDGPCFYRTKTGELLLFWSSLKDNQYVQAVAKSSNGDIDGDWENFDELLYDTDGGHGMAFKSKEGQLYFTLHAPNINYQEHPVFLKIEDMGDKIVRL
ncbi:MAG: glycoside hydrolase family 43 protein [Defluviitaleaceae bacterium]|nr:glycoside hydrolase family 43 protein [Defluviitaleaceae bacterium]